MPSSPSMGWSSSAVGPCESSWMVPVNPPGWPLEAVVRPICWRPALPLPPAESFDSRRYPSTRRLYLDEAQ
uniref:Uncharacterized protein n=1 Tax=Peronospora matthiolae TaxID=2874970 RepID=A0AAV1V9J0_9STRA